MCEIIRIGIVAACGGIAAALLGYVVLQLARQIAMLGGGWRPISDCPENGRAIVEFRNAATGEQHAGRVYVDDEYGYYVIEDENGKELRGFYPTHWRPIK